MHLVALVVECEQYAALLGKLGGIIKQLCNGNTHQVGMAHHGFFGKYVTLTVHGYAFGNSWCDGIDGTGHHYQWNALLGRWQLCIALHVGNQYQVVENIRQQARVLLYTCAVVLTVFLGQIHARHGKNL